MAYTVPAGEANDGCCTRKGRRHPTAAQPMKLHASAALPRSGAEGLQGCRLQSAVEGRRSWVPGSVKDVPQYWLRASFPFRLHIWATEEMLLTPGKTLPLGQSFWEAGL